MTLSTYNLASLLTMLKYYNRCRIASLPLILHDLWVEKVKLLSAVAVNLRKISATRKLEKWTAALNGSSFWTFNLQNTLTPSKSTLCILPFTLFLCTPLHAYMRNEIRVMSQIHYPDTVFLILDVVKLKNKKPRETNGSFAKNLRMLEPNDDFDYKLPV